MNLTYSVSDKVNYLTNAVNENIQKIATNPSTLKKTFQLMTRVFAMIDLYYHQSIQPRPITDAIQGAVDLLEFYGSFNDIVFWIHPFSKETLDKGAFRTSLTHFLSVQDSPNSPKKMEAQEINRLVGEIIQEVMEKTIWCSQEEVRNVVKTKLENSPFSERAQEIAGNVTIQQESRPLSKLMANVCFTIVDLSSNVLTLKKWDIVELSKLTLWMGSQLHAFSVILNLESKKALGSLSCIGFVITIADASYRAMIQGSKYYSADPKDKQLIYQELRKNVLTLASTGADLISTAAPLIFTIKPSTVVALGLIAKGTGLICIFLK